MAGPCITAAQLMSSGSRGTSVLIRKRCLMHVLGAPLCGYVCVPLRVQVWLPDKHI